VMHLIDTLDIGGAERVAVNLVNSLPRENYKCFLCSTREDGPLDELVAKDVQRLSLGRRWRFDIFALNRLIAYIRLNNIQILHAHSTSLFIAVFSSLLPPYPVVIWHIHSGKYAIERVKNLLYRLCTRRVHGVIAVNQSLVEWSQRELNIPKELVWYVPNFVELPKMNQDSNVRLPGHPGNRIVCVANIRPEKGILVLIDAMEVVVTQAPHAHLIIAGSTSDSDYFAQIRRKIEEKDLEHFISLLGRCQDIATILRACDIGVISSVSEGLPLALLEYGAAGLPVVSTQVGQCSEVLEEGQAGLLVPPSEPQALAEALLKYLGSSVLRDRYGHRLNTRIKLFYSKESSVDKTSKIYQKILTEA